MFKLINPSTFYCCKPNGYHIDTNILFYGFMFYMRVLLLAYLEIKNINKVQKLMPIQQNNMVAVYGLIN